MQRTTVNKAAIYVNEPARSHPDGADAQRQLAEALEYCQAKRLEVVVHYRDEQGSREEFQTMMTDADPEHRPFDHVIVWKLMYFALMIEESILGRDRLAAHGIRLLSGTERSPNE